MVPQSKAASVAVALVCLASFVAPALAQKGMGDAVGVARSGTSPSIVGLAGTVTAVKTSACPTTTGRSTTGMHIMMKSSDGRMINLHLGPATVLEPYRDRLLEGSNVNAHAFRTDKMPEGAYVAQSIQLGGEAIVLRDAALRPTWALGGGQGRGVRGSGGGSGMGPRGGGGRAPCWWQ